MRAAALQTCLLRRAPVSSSRLLLLAPGRPGHAEVGQHGPQLTLVSATALIWFKRDLRLQDHAPLVAAQAFERTLALYVIEPEWLCSPECDPRHVAFALSCVAQLQSDLAAIGLSLLVRVGSMLKVLDDLQREAPFTHLFSHEETGPGWSYTRDRAVAGWCRQQQVEWLEWPQTGVLRPLRSRSGWAAAWARRMNAPQTVLQGGFNPALGGLSGAACALPTLRDLGLVAPAQAVPAAGERAAQMTLDSFLAGRGRDYRRAMSSPLSADQACSRLSAHLAFGTISMRRVHQATESVIQSTDDRGLAQALRGFSGRLRWHCHFMQKLEDEPAIEWRNFSRSHDGLRAGDGVCEAPWNSEHFQAWCEGRTGYPMVDACMRQLRATGWINFRMRAMLVSFAAYHLWLHWRQPGLFLARQFLDFEPGIHWSQMQMQSGTTGINTLRIYSPAKQARDHDPMGDYVRRWVPEIDTLAYAVPVVDERVALAAAKLRLYGLRKASDARAEADAIQHKHGSRKSGLARSTAAARAVKRSKSTAPDGQGELF
jgi:deoxyribodipyrimidine photo-lyase